MKKQVMDLGLCAQARDEFWRSMPPVRQQAWPARVGA
jgi:hypothetical protein